MTKQWIVNNYTEQQLENGLNQAFDLGYFVTHVLPSNSERDSYIVIATRANPKK